jgi:hypothetical protein
VSIPTIRVRFEDAILQLTQFDVDGGTAPIGASGMIAANRAKVGKLSRSKTSRAIDFIQKRAILRIERPKAEQAEKGGILLSRKLLHHGTRQKSAH